MEPQDRIGREFLAECTFRPRTKEAMNRELLQRILAAEEAAEREEAAAAAAAAGDGDGAGYDDDY